MDQASGSIGLQALREGQQRDQCELRRFPGVKCMTQQYWVNPTGRITSPEGLIWGGVGGECPKECCCQALHKLVVCMDPINNKYPTVGMRRG